MAKRARTQAEKSEATRQALLDAATRVVGRDGYAGASIGKVTAAANVAQGTFYYYFDSQQELFDCLLPTLGERLLQEIREAVAGGTTGIMREEIGFRTYFNFMARTPEFYRVLTEAEVFAPRAYWTHMTNISSRYLRALKRSWQKGEIRNFEESELENLTYLLSGAMFYLTHRYHASGSLPPHAPEDVVRTYVKFVAQGMGVESWQDHVEPEPRLSVPAKRGTLPEQRNEGVSVARSQTPNVSAERSPTRETSAEATFNLGPADTVFRSDAGPDLLSVLVKYSRTVLASAKLGQEYQLQDLSQHVIAVPEPHENLVARVFNPTGCRDIAVLTVLVESSLNSHRTLAVANGVFRRVSA
jgi:AcrR family transcriptional regulator